MFDESIWSILALNRSKIPPTNYRSQDIADFMSVQDSSTPQCMILQKLWFPESRGHNKQSILEVGLKNVTIFLGIIVFIGFISFRILRNYQFKYTILFSLGQSQANVLVLRFGPKMNTKMTTVTTILAFIHS